MSKIKVCTFICSYLLDEEDLNLGRLCVVVEKQMKKCTMQDFHDCDTHNLLTIVVNHQQFSNSNIIHNIIKKKTQIARKKLINHKAENCTLCHNGITCCLKSYLREIIMKCYPL